MYAVLVMNERSWNLMALGFDTFFRSKLASSMAMAMSPEIQTLKVLEMETKNFLKIHKKIQALNAKQFREYEALKAEQHERLIEVSDRFSCIKKPFLFGSFLCLLY